MRFSIAALTAALVACVSANASASASASTEVVTQYTTYCPEATSIVHGSHTYSISTVRISHGTEIKTNTRFHPSHHFQ